MANWAIPTLSDLKIDVLDQLKLRDVDSYTMAESPVNPPTGAKRWNTSLNKFESWNGSAWVTMVVSIAGGGTGATDINGFLDNFNLGSMALQDNNAVNITGGQITGLSLLVVSGGTHLAGSFFSGSASVVMTNSAGYLLETAIADGTIYTRVAANEIITGSWTFQGQVGVAAIQISSGSPAIAFYQSDGAANQKLTSFLADGNIFELRFYNDDYSVYTSPITWTRSGNTVTTVTANGSWRFNNPNTYLGYGVEQTVLNFDAPTAVSKSIYFGISGTTGRFICAGDILYYDQTTHWFRTTVGGQYARIDGSGIYSSSAIWSATGTYLYPNASGTFMGVSAASINFFADNYGFINKGNTSAYAYFASASIDFHTTTVNAYGPHLYIGGGSGTGIGFHRLNATYCTINLHGAGGGTEIYNVGGTAKIMELRDTSVTVHASTLYVQNGTAGAPSFSFISNGKAGFYYNPANPTVEYGARFDVDGGRSVMRCYAATAGIDFIVANNFPLKLTNGNVYVGEDIHTNLQVRGETFPRVHHGYWIGLTGASFYQASAQAFVATSDIREKDVHGPITNVLDVIDDVNVFFASFKEALRPSTMIGNRDWTRRFPSFSAQEVKAKIDDVYDVRIVEDSDPDHLGMIPDRLIPLLWQGMKELLARVKALEP